VDLGTAKHLVSTISAAGVYLPEGRHPIIPIFHHSIIPIESEAKNNQMWYNNI
jgi:hypothetical protein